MASIIYQGAPGSLPHSFDYTAIQDNPVMIQFTGSVWSGTGNTMIGLKLEIGGVEVGTTNIFNNGASTHRATVPVSIKHKFTIGTPVTMTVSVANAASIFDVNDTISVVILGACDN